MKIKHNQLAKQLQNNLSSVYLLHGDEPLLIEQCFKQIASHAQTHGFDETTSLQVTSQFKWQQLEEQLNSLSLFSEKTFIKLFMPTGKPGKTGGAVLHDIASQLNTDQLLVIVTNKLDSSTLKTAWYKAIEKHGIVIPIWPLQDNELLSWIKRSLAKNNVSASDEALAILMDNTAGNLLATQQEIEKLYLIYGENTTLSANDIRSAIVDRAHFTIFDLVDAWLHDNKKLYLRILQSLKSQGIAATLVLWALSREIRQLANAHNDQQTLQYLPAFRKNLLIQHVKKHNCDYYYHLLKLCSSIDCAVKGLNEQNPWFLFEQIVAPSNKTMLS